MRLLKNVYLLSGSGFGMLGNIYGIVHGGRIIMVDCATDRSDLDCVDRTLAYWELDKLPISDLLITHWHNDHAGNAATIHRRGAELTAGLADALRVEAGGMPEGGDPFFPPYEACPVARKIGDDCEFDLGGLKVRAICVPGHTDGSLFYEMEIDSKICLFTGDALSATGLSGELPELGFRGSPEFSREKTVEGFAKVWNKRADALFGGHCTPVCENAEAVLRGAYQKALLEWR